MVMDWRVEKTKEIRTNQPGCTQLVALSIINLLWCLSFANAIWLTIYEWQSWYSTVQPREETRISLARQSAHSFTSSQLYCTCTAVAMLLDDERCSYR